jgi:hypothetical protein
MHKLCKSLPHMAAAKTKIKPRRRMLCIDVAAHPWVRELLNAMQKRTNKSQTELILDAMRHVYGPQAGKRLEGRIPG